jgi:hypothetical protein
MLYAVKRCDSRSDFHVYKVLLSYGMMTLLSDVCRELSVSAGQE